MSKLTHIEAITRAAYAADRVVRRAMGGSVLPLWTKLDDAARVRWRAFVLRALSGDVEPADVATAQTAVATARAAAEELGLCIGDRDDIGRMSCAVARRMGVQVPAMMGRARDMHTAHARAMAMMFMMDENYSSGSIGAYFDGRDHSTVLACVRTMRRLVRTNKLLRADHKALTETFDKTRSRA